LSEKTVTLGCVQLKALMVGENVQSNLKKQQVPILGILLRGTYIDEDNIIPKREAS